MTPALQPLRRIAAYCVIADSDEFLLVRASAKSGTPGVWSLPGGAVDHGENPVDTVVRETAAETGLSVAVLRLRDVLADMRALPDRAVRDSKDPNGAVLVYTKAEWRAFVGGVKDKEFDDLA